MPFHFRPSLALSLRNRWLVLFSMFLFLQQPVWAQASLYTDSVSDSLAIQEVTSARKLLEAPKQETTNRYSLRKNTALLAAGAGIWIATYTFVDEPLQQFTQSNRNPVADAIAYVVQPLGKPSNLAPIAATAALGGIVLKDSKLQKAGMVSLGSIMASAVITGTLKNTFHRYRPSSTTENHLFDGIAQETNNTSLPSSHTSTAFAMATSVATVYKDHQWVPPIAYGVATLVGLSRINDNAHWATDVMAGAAVGYFTAKGVMRLYEEVDQRLNIRKQRRLLLSPQIGLQSGTVSATLIF